MNPLIDMLLHMLKVAEYYNKRNPTAAKPLNDCLAFYLNSTIPMIAPIIRDMKTKGLIDKAGRITQKGKSYLNNRFESQNNGQLACTVKDLFEEIMGRVNNGASTLDFIVPRADTSYAFSEFALKWSEEYTPFLDCTVYFEEEDNQDEQIDTLHQEPVMQSLTSICNNK